ncbi:prostaglandin reductase-3-like [Dysidea avara]|uniref:prostaglandin reductase-3-like n=1 Tax=Dysidea avara TaxID=196820 RepID=UPI00332ECE12
MYRKLVATNLSTKFREVVKIQSLPIPVPGQGQLLVRNRFLGINASDINFTAGRYDRRHKPPLDLGFESVGEVAAVGTDCSRGYKLGDAVGVFENGAFSEYMIIREDRAIPLPQCAPSYLPLLLSGLTASVALQCAGEIKEGDKVLVTAAAGGTGQLAVQLAKAAGCHVIGTCSSEEKMALLRQLGCDRPINYKQESLKEVLHNEYPRGVDVVYESVGGEMFTICVNSLAVKGRLIIIGSVSTYKGTSDTLAPPVPVSVTRLLAKSASIRGFFLPHYARQYPSHLAKMVAMVNDGKLKCVVDNGNTGGPFVGLESVSDAVDYLYSGKNCGKVFVQLNQTSKL